MICLEPPTPKVLLVEDNGDDERLALRAFKRCGVPVEVTVARDGIQALSLLGLDSSPANDSAPSERFVPNLIVCDLKMPMISGDEFISRVRISDALPDVQCVVFSSSDDQHDVDHCMAKGADGYIVKPIDYTEYLTCISGMVKKFTAPLQRLKKIPASRVSA
jgi:CheY-like chemotaxis protein